MASNTKEGVKKILAARQNHVQIEHLKFELKQRDEKIERMKKELEILRKENEALKSSYEQLD